MFVNSYLSPHSIRFVFKNVLILNEERKKLNKVLANSHKKINCLCVERCPCALTEHNVKICCERYKKSGSDAQCVHTSWGEKKINFLRSFFLFEDFFAAITTNGREKCVRWKKYTKEAANFLFQHFVFLFQFVYWTVSCGFFSAAFTDDKNHKSAM